MSSASAPRVLGEALYILDGNVGIGTITPRSIFDIRSTLPVLIDSVAGIGIGTTNPLVSLEIHRKDSILLPKGTSDERPEEGVQGYIRYNTDTSTFEGYGAGDAWGSLGGVKDTNQDTYIAAELYPGSNDDALRFVTCNVQRMTIDSYGNVGIGTSTMSSLVDIYGATTSIAPLVTINQQGTGTILDVQDGGVSAFIVIDGGNVGIGLTEPMDTLHVNGGIISTNTQTSNLTIWNSLNIPMTSTNIRTRVQVHHIRKSFYVDAPTQSDFVVTYPGAFSGHQSNVQVFLGRDQLSYISPTIKDYDLTLTYLMEQQVTEYTISLTTPAVYGDIVDIIVWPQITQNSPEEQGIVYQSVLVNDSYWLEQDRTIPVRNTVPIYVLGNVGIGTTMPLEKLDIYGNVQVNGGVSITGNVLVTGDILPSACNIYNLGTSNFRFKDLFLSGNTIDLGGTLISRDETEGSGGGIKVTSETGEAVDTTVRNLFAQGNIGIGLSNPQARLDIDGGIKLAGHVIPATNVAFDLGSSGARFRDLYLSGNTLDLGGTLLKRHVTGPLMVMSEATQSMESIIGRHAYIEGTANACNVIINTNGTGTSLLVKQESQGQAVVDFQAITDYQSSLKSVFLINNNGLVGIGTTLPQEACHVEGNSLVNGAVISSNVSINTNGTGTSLVINQKGSEAIANFQRDGTSVMFVKQTGHVGINTALPAEALHVEGNVLASGTITASNLVILGDYVTLDTITSNTEQMVITNAGTGPALIVTQTGPEPIADFYDDGGVLALRIADGGNVGIGTAKPRAQLHVLGTTLATTFSGKLEHTLSKGDYITGTNFTNEGSTTWAVDATSANTASKVVARDASGDFSAGIINAELAGNASTATTLKTSRTINGVSFNGSANISVNTVNALTRGAYLTGGNTTFNGSAVSTWDVNATSANTSSTVVARDASGNFSAGGISLANNNGISWSANSDGAAINFFSTGNGAGASYLEIKTTDDGDEPIIFKQTNTERMRIHTNGFVGIGTTTPIQQLDVTGGVNILGALFQNGVKCMMIKNIFEEYDNQNYGFNTSWALGRTWTLRNYNANSRLMVYLYVPFRNESAGWGGLYTQLDYNINNTGWTGLGHNGWYMMSSGADILIYSNWFYLPLTITSNFTCQFRCQHASYDGTANINGSNNIGAGTANSYGINVNQHYYKLIVVEIGG